MLNFQLVQSVKTLFGAGSTQLIGELLKKNNRDTALIVCDKGVRKAGIVEKITDSLNKNDISFIIFDKVTADAPVSNIVEGDRIYKENNCKAVIAVGGGSSMDTAKGINLLQYNDGPILRFTDFSTPMNKCDWLISVPTTSGTGSEMSDGLIISDENGIKRPILAPNAMSNYAVLDPNLTLGLPSLLTAITGFDALSHAIEGYTSTAANAITDQINESIIKTVVKWLPDIVKDGKNIEGRTHMMVNASLSGWMLGYSHTHAGHSFAHVMGSFFNIPHGEAVSFALPHVLEFNAPAVPEKTKDIIRMLGSDISDAATAQEIGKAAKDALSNFIKEINMRPVTAFNIDRTKLDEASREVENEGFQLFNPRKMTTDDARKIFDHILN